MTPTQHLAVQARIAAAERLGRGADDVAIAVLATELLAEMVVRLQEEAR